MSSLFKSELLAITALRAKFPNMGQRTLARRIVNREFTEEGDRTQAANVGVRSYASTYAAIRRIDAKQRVLAAA